MYAKTCSLLRTLNADAPSWCFPCLCYVLWLQFLLGLQFFHEWQKTNALWHPSSLFPILPNIGCVITSQIAVHSCQAELIPFMSEEGQSHRQNRIDWDFCYDSKFVVLVWIGTQIWVNPYPLLFFWLSPVYRANPLMFLHSCVWPKDGAFVLCPI